MALHWAEIDRLVKAQRLVDPTASEEDLARTLRVWWAIKYSRPFKDPLLLTYTLNDLIFEYLTHYYMDPANDPKAKAEVEKQSKADDEWAEKMLAKMREQQKAKETKDDPMDHPKEIQAAIIPELPELSTNFDQ